MKDKLIYPLIATLILTGAACRGDRKNGANQQQFETVQEGSAAGVTSTIHGPGEAIPPMTGTNADTTTAFTLNPNLAGQPADGTIAGTMPAQPAYPSAVPTGTYIPPPPAPMPVQRQPVVIQRTNPAPVDQQPQQPQPVEPAPQQPTETVEPVPPPSQTDTTVTQPTQTAPPPTQTAPPPRQAKPKKDQQQKPPEDDQDEQTDTADPPPPPPPPM